jgi:hypothetical protein
MSRLIPSVLHAVVLAEGSAAISAPMPLSDMGTPCRWPIHSAQSEV